MSEPTSAGTLKRNISLFLLGTVLFAAAYTQAPLYYSNQNQYFLHGLAQARPRTRGEDWLVKTVDPTPIFSGLVAFTASVLHPWAFHVYYALLMGAYAAAALLLFVSVVGDDTARRRWPVFAALFVAVHAALPRWASYQWLGLDYPWYLQGGLAGQYVLGAMFQPSSFGVLLLLAIALFVRGHPYLAAICIGIGATFHTTYLLPGALITLGFMTALASRRRFGAAVATGALALILVLPVTLHVLLTFGPTSPEAFAQAQDIVVNFRIPHHCRPDLWLDGIATFQIAWMALGITLTFGTPLFWVLAVPFALMAALTLAQVFTGSHTLALLFPWRVSAVLVPVATTIILSRLARAAPRLVEAPAARALSALVVIALVAAGVWISVAGLGYRTNDEELGVMNYVRSAKQPGDLYLVPVRIPDLAASTRGSLSSDFKPLPEKRTDERIIPLDMQRFRLYTGAPIYVDFKSIPYKDVDVLDWRRRLAVAERVHGQLKHNDVQAALAELQASGITHVLVAADTHIEHAELEKVYEDEYYALYRVTARRVEDTRLSVDDVRF
jgi:Domain of unknown function (DUF6798)